MVESNGCGYTFNIKVNLTWAITIAFSDQGMQYLSFRCWVNYRPEFILSGRGLGPSYLPTGVWVWLVDMSPAVQCGGEGLGQSRVWGREWGCLLGVIRSPPPLSAGSLTTAQTPADPQTCRDASADTQVSLSCQSLSRCSAPLPHTFIPVYIETCEKCMLLSVIVCAISYIKSNIV